MDHHVDIDLRPDPETSPHQLMSALFTKLHRALAVLGGNRIGVSFPGMDTRSVDATKRDERYPRTAGSVACDEPGPAVGG